MLGLVIAFDDAKDTDMICSRILCQEPRHDGCLCCWDIESVSEEHVGTQS